MLMTVDNLNTQHAMCMVAGSKAEIMSAFPQTYQPKGLGTMKPVHDYKKCTQNMIRGNSMKWEGNTRFVLQLIIRIDPQEQIL